MNMTGGWTFWVDRPPPPNQIVECRRLGDSLTLSFWVLPRLMKREWNVADVIWRPMR